LLLPECRDTGLSTQRELLASQSLDAFFFLIGAYWLATGEKFDETAYRFVLCRLYSFERCSALVEKPARIETSEQLKREMEALTKATQELRRQQQEAAEEKRREEERAKAKLEAEAERARVAARRQEEENRRTAEKEALQKREEAGDLAFRNAINFWSARNFKVAAEYSEQAIRIWSVLPQVGDARVQNKIAAAHSMVGLSLVLLGATSRDQAYGCTRLDMARNIYVSTGNSPMVAHVDQNRNIGRCK
jgi:flagellar biosynthesis GTPase FlhF